MVLLRAFGFSQSHTTEEFHRRHPNLIHDPSRQHSVGRIHSRFHDSGSVSDKQRAGRLRTSPADEFSNVALVKITVHL